MPLNILIKMQFSLSTSIEVLERTPNVLSAMLSGISTDWISNNEGENTWNALEVVAHLIICEKTDWLVRTKVFLSDDGDKTFSPLDMNAHFELSKKHSMSELLEQFSQIRQANIQEINRLRLTESDYSTTAIHPKLGTVQLQELLAAWVVHDLGHIGQISRLMAKQYKEAVGPWIAYLRILKD